MNTEKPITTKFVWSDGWIDHRSVPCPLHPIREVSAYARKDRRTALWGQVMNGNLPDVQARFELALSNDGRFEYREKTNV